MYTHKLTNTNTSTDLYQDKKKSICGRKTGKVEIFKSQGVIFSFDKKGFVDHPPGHSYSLIDPNVADKILFSPVRPKDL